MSEQTINEIGNSEAAINPVIIGSGGAGAAESAIAKSVSGQMDYVAGMNGDWAVYQPEFDAIKENFRQLPQLLAATDQKALEAFRSEYLEGTMNVKVRNGVAIIPISGPIFKNFNWYRYYYGGTALTALARDFQFAINNRDVHAILFEINTPGGEVAGVAEMAQMIRAVRNKKKFPMTARVAYQMCSAGLWIGVQAGDVVIDRTAQVGSLGVCTTYFDTTKMLKNFGVEIIEMFSEQSPYKNLPPTTDEGKKRIINRLSAICKVFGADVAEGRDVPIETVWEKFGQGDVLVGQAAIDAGLADRFGSFEETLDLLAKTHNPNYVPSPMFEDDEESDQSMLDEVEPDDEEEEDEAKTLNLPAGAESSALQDASSAAADNNAASNPSRENSKQEILPSEENMSDQIQTPAAESAGEQNKTAAGAEAPQFTAAEYLHLQEEVARLKSEKAEADEQKEKAEKAQAETELKMRMTAAANEILGENASEQTLGEETAFLTDLAQAFGEDSAQFKAYVTKQKASSAQNDTAEIFREAGKTGASDTANPQSAEAKLDRMAKERAKKDGCTYHAAYRLVADENQELYAQYEAEANG